MKGNRMVLEIMSRSDNVALARVAVASFASQLDFTLGALEEIKVAVSEAVTNSIVHGYGDGSEEMVRIEGSIRGDTLEIAVIDRGRGIENIEKARQPSYSTDPERMGLGFVFMESFMDTLSVQSKAGEGTEVRMSKRVSADSSQGEG